MHTISIFVDQNRMPKLASISDARLTFAKTCEIQQTLSFATCVPG